MSLDQPSANGVLVIVDRYPGPSSGRRFYWIKPVSECAILKRDSMSVDIDGVSIPVGAREFQATIGDQILTPTANAASGALLVRDSKPLAQDCARMSIWRITEMLFNNDFKPTWLPSSGALPLKHGDIIVITGAGALVVENALRDSAGFRVMVYLNQSVESIRNEMSGSLDRERLGLFRERIDAFIACMCFAANPVPHFQVSEQHNDLRLRLVRAETFCMGAHFRLGIKSVVLLLNQDLVRAVAAYF